ncbi:MAG: CBS domain-containing protein [Gammaproteobacteria bacterium]
MTDALVHTLVSQCMTHFVLSVGPYDSLARAWELMMTNRVRRLPVLDEGRLVGIITQTDVLNAKPADPAHHLALADVARELDTLTVAPVMTRDPLCIYDNDTVGHAAELMLEHKIGGLPVVDTSGALVGLITESNLFRLLAQRWREDNLIFSGAR